MGGQHCVSGRDSGAVLGQSAIQDVAQVGGRDYYRMTIPVGAGSAAALCADSVTQERCHPVLVEANAVVQHGKDIYRVLVQSVAHGPHHRGGLSCKLSLGE